MTLQQLRMRVSCFFGHHRVSILNYPRCVICGKVAPCKRDHRPPQGPNEDIGQCVCGMPIGVLRSGNQSFGWHIADCSLRVDHAGYCKPGGEGHVVPEGWKIRG